MSLVQGQVADTVAGVAGIPEDKKEQAVETTASTIVESVKKYATPENIDKVMSMLNSGGHAESVIGNSEMAKGVSSNVVTNLIEKVGIKPEVAQKISSMVIPAIISLFKNKVNDDNEPGFNVGSLLGALTGNKSSGGIMDMVGGLFGKKG